VEASISYAHKNMLAKELICCYVFSSSEMGKRASNSVYVAID